MKKSLQSRERMGDEATLLYDMDLSFSMKEICESHGKEKGGPWECYHAVNFYGWEAERVVVVTTGLPIFLEMATRAKRELILIIAESEREDLKKFYHKIQVVIKTAEDDGLVDLEVIEIENSNFLCCSVM